jgi:chromosome segregation ATPase
MTEEEMNQKIAEAEERANKAEAEIEDLKTQRSNQNSYITKLEGKVKGLENQVDTVKAAANNTPALAPEITEYFQKKRREDYTEQAVTEIISQVGEDKYNCLKDELNNFLKLYMTEKNVSVRYIIDSFHLLLGRALANPDHEIHKVIGDIKKVEEDKPVVEDKPATESDQELFRNNLNNMVNRTMTNDDMDAGGAPEVKAPTVQNTQEAMKSFKNRLLNLDSSKFE